MTINESTLQIVEDSQEAREVELFKLVMKYMVSYLLEGFVNPDITKGFNIDGEKALNFNTALKIRFLLDEEIRGFLKRLGTYLRSIRTELSREMDIRKGEVRGRIDWRRTIQAWTSSIFQDKTTLVINKPIRNYDIPENLVLKKIVMLLSELISDDQVKVEIERNYDWNQRLKEGRHHVQEVLKNVYFKRIMEKDIEITSRMKAQVRKSRKKLYRESCKILEKYQSVFLQHELGQLLRDTFINPNNIEKTYELVCLFRIIEVLEKASGWKIEKLREITINRNETAVLAHEQSDYRIRVFYNVTEPAKLSFYDSTEPPITKRALNKITSAYFGEKKERTRRPDIILELAQGKVVKDYVVFEVKYTENMDYVVDGIYQALHYLFDLKRLRSQNYFFKRELGNGYNAGVIAYRLDLSPSCDKIDQLGNKSLKVKLFDFTDLQDSEALNVFFHNFLKQHDLVKSRYQ
jgi:hypothetical protein